MNFLYTNLETCHKVTGLVVVIDVLRAFSTAAYALSRDAEKVILVSDVDEALSFKSQIPNSKAMGEIHGLRPEGFDFGNSPTQILEQDLSGITMIQRTSAGTQGAVRCKKADVLLASSFVVASATAEYIRELAPETVTFVITGQYAPEHGDEDLAHAEYLELLLMGQHPDKEPFIKRVFDSRDAIQHLDPKDTNFPLSDLDLCTNIDAFDFAMPITRENDLLIMRKSTI